MDALFVEGLKRSLLKLVFCSILFSFLFIQVSLAHVGEHTEQYDIVTNDIIEHEEENEWRHFVLSLPEPATYLSVVGVFVLALSIFIVILGRTDNLPEKHYKYIFLAIVIPVIVVSGYIAIHTIGKNLVSDTKGPVHWHADYQIWVCGEQLDLIDPVFPSNKIGSPLFHEHNDDRIHIEGTVISYKDITLKKYFEVIGGKLADGEFAFRNIEKETGNEVTTTVRDGYPCVTGTYQNEPSYLKICKSWINKDWTYDNYKYKPERKIMTVGTKTWQ